MKRRLFTILSAMSLLLCLGSSILGFRSYWMGHFLQYAGVQTATDERIYKIWEVSDGRGWLAIGFEEWREAQSSLVSYETGWHSLYSRDPDVPYYGPSFMGIICIPSASPGDIRTGYGLILPYWLLALICALMPTVWLRQAGKKRHRLKHGFCLICGYDLRASKDRCPECGTAILATESKA